MTDWQWIDLIESRLKAAEEGPWVNSQGVVRFSDTRPEPLLVTIESTDIAKLIETVKVMRKALQDIDKFGCNYCSEGAHKALEKCK